MTTTVYIEDSSPEAHHLIEYLKTFSFVKVSEKTKKLTFEEASVACGAVTHEKFWSEARRQLKEYYSENA